MSFIGQLLKWRAISVLVLATFAVSACGGIELAAQANNGMIPICHATGDAAGPYDEITIDINQLIEHADHQDDIIPAPTQGCPNVVEAGGNDGKIDICHATGSATNPYNEITIDFNGLRGHRNHEGDLIPAPEGGCALVTPASEITATPTLTPTSSMTATPSMTVTPTATAPGNGDGMITICHATGSAKNPYVLITVSINGLNGHGKHTRDIIPAPAGGCPK
jgi:hypothetical protein